MSSNPTPQDERRNHFSDGSSLCQCEQRNLDDMLRTKRKCVRLPHLWHNGRLKKRVSERCGIWERPSVLPPTSSRATKSLDTMTGNLGLPVRTRGGERCAQVPEELCAMIVPRRSLRTAQSTRQPGSGSRKSSGSARMRRMTRVVATGKPIQISPRAPTLTRACRALRARVSFRPWGRPCRRALGVAAPRRRARPTPHGVGFGVFAWREATYRGRAA